MTTPHQTFGASHYFRVTDLTWSIIVNNMFSGFFLDEAIFCPETPAFEKVEPPLISVPATL